MDRPGSYMYYHEVVSQMGITDLQYAAISSSRHFYTRLGGLTLELDIIRVYKSIGEERNGIYIRNLALEVRDHKQSVLWELKVEGIDPR